MEIYMKISAINNKILSIIFSLWLSSALATSAFGLTSSYTYDNLNRLTQVDYGNGLTEQYTYDAAGNRLSRVVANSSNPVTYTLSFIKTGTGGGFVSISPGEIVCNSNYSSQFNSGTIVTLHPSVAEYSIFPGWSNDCSGTGDCTIPMDGNKTAKATFTKDTAHSTRIDNGGTTSNYPTLQEAYNKAPNPGTVKAWGTDFTEDLKASIIKSVTLKGGYDSGYSANSSYTALHGTLTIGSGSVVIENFIIQ
jgi:YD repeat-containing protein